MTDDKEVTAEITPEDAEFRSRAEEAGIPGIIVSMYGNALRRLVETERNAENETCEEVCLAQQNIVFVRASIPLITHDPANIMAVKCAAAIRARRQA